MGQTAPTPAWWLLKDNVKLRCRGLCEFCSLRRGDQLHHRHYRTVGGERSEDVMLLCDPCHAFLSGCRNTVTIRPGSLADQGDTGLGETPQWVAYLAEAVRRCG